MSPSLAKIDLLTVPESARHKLPYPFMASELTEDLEVDTDDLPRGPDLNEVARRYLKDSRGRPQEICAALKTVWAEVASLPVSEPLLQQADIQLFASNTSDTSTARAINEMRFGGNSKTAVLSHSPNKAEDITGDLAVYGRE